LAIVKVLFSYPCTPTPLGELIEAVEGKGEPSHTGIILYGKIFEALANGFVKSPLNSYDAFKHTLVEVDVPNLSHARLEAKNLLYTPYGWWDCIISGIKSLFGLQLRGNGTRSVHCSEAVTRILRAGGLEILPEVYADDITSADLYKALQEVKTSEVTLYPNNDTDQASGGVAL